MVCAVIAIVGTLAGIIVGTLAGIILGYVLRSM